MIHGCFEGSFRVARQKGLSCDLLYQRCERRGSGPTSFLSMIKHEKRIIDNRANISSSNHQALVQVFSCEFCETFYRTPLDNCLYISENSDEFLRTLVKSLKTKFFYKFCNIFKNALLVKYVRTAATEHS